MDKKTLKDLAGILDKKLDQKLKPISKQLDSHENQFQSINQKLDSLTLDMIEVQKKTDVIADIHDMVKDTRGTVKDHEQRLQALETAA